MKWLWALLGWWGWKKETVVRLALPGECPLGCEPLSRRKDGGCTILGVVDGRVHRYAVDEIALSPNLVTKKECAPAEVIFSGYLAEYSYKRAIVIIRGTGEELVMWLERMNAMKAS